MEIPRHWRLRKQRYSLQGEICPRCDEKIFPPRGAGVHPNCRGEVRIPFEMDSKGEIYSHLEMAKPSLKGMEVETNRKPKFMFGFSAS